LVEKEVAKLVFHLVHEHLLWEARMCIIARCFLLRVADELFPLQTDGREGLDPADTRWHSQINFEPQAVTIVLRTRKNAPEGAVLRRTCSCALRPRLLCGVCALRAQVQSAEQRGIGPRTAIFGPCKAAQSLLIVRAACELLGLPRPGWHSFRRGMARDMLNAGCSLAQILDAGGWRSAAFLRYLSRRDIDARVALELAELQDSD
jgi:hypothetical protein